jgi:hypothetical protein
MKKFIKHAFTIAFALVMICALFISACEKTKDLEPSSYSLPEMITEQGGVFTAMDGNVILTVPAGAVTQPVRFSVLEYTDMVDNNYILKSIIINPSVSFKAPVTLELKYDGELSKGQIISESMSLKVLNWGKEEDLLTSSLEKCMTCCLNLDGKTLKVCTCQTGIFAVGINE